MPNPTMATMSMDLNMLCVINVFFCSLKFYIPFFLVATKCNIADYWFKKSIMRRPKFIFNYKCNYQNLTQRTIMPIHYKEFTNIWLDLQLILWLKNVVILFIYFKIFNI
jgi:hypothetical protein